MAFPLPLAPKSDPLSALKAALISRPDAPPAQPQLAPQADTHVDTSNPTPLESKSQAGYATDGPFYCGRCEYFIKPSSCKKVEGPIRPQDCCNEFSSGQKGSAAPENQKSATNAQPEAVSRG